MLPGSLNSNRSENGQNTVKRESLVCQPSFSRDYVKLRGCIWLKINRFHWGEITPTSRFSWAPPEVTGFWAHFVDKSFGKGMTFARRNGWTKNFLLTDIFC